MTKPGSKKPQQHSITYQKNMEVFHKNFPGIEHYFEQVSQQKVAEVQMGHSKMATLKLNHSDHQSYYLHSTYQPTKEAKQWVNGLPEEWEVAVILGFGLGYHVEELLNRYPDRVIMVLEPYLEVLAASLHARDLRPIFGNTNCFLVIGTEQKQIADKLMEFIKSNFKKTLVYFAWPPYQRLWGEFWESLQDKLTGMLGAYLTNLITYEKTALLWQKNFFRGLSLSAQDPGAALFAADFQNRPAILVGAGPSLEKNIHLLKEVYDRALIVAAGTAIELLIKADIRPHAMVILDADPIIYDHLNHAVGIETLGDIALIYAPVVDRRIIESYPGPRFVMGVDAYTYSLWVYDWMKRPKGIFTSGPSVANISWDWLYKVGCDPIALIGVDLALTNRSLHAKGHSINQTFTDEHVEEIQRLKPGAYTYVEGVVEEKVLVSRPFATMRLWFENRLAQMASHRRCIQATEGGAKIAGTQIMTLQEVIDNYCQEDFLPKEKINQLFDNSRKDETDESFTEDLDKLYHHLDNLLEEIAEICGEGGKLATDTLESPKKSHHEALQHYQDVSDKLQAVDQKLSSKEVYNFFIRTVNVHNVESLNMLMGTLSQEKNPAVRLRRLATIYGAFFEGTQRMTHWIREQASMITTSQEENLEKFHVSAQNPITEPEISHETTSALSL